MKKATLKDIARICECSVTTVARALRDSDTISVKMREKIHATANELGYIPNSLATSMRTGKTNTIGVILQDFRNPYFAVMAKYIEIYAREKGYNILFMTTNEVSSREMEACKSVISQNVDGVLLFPIQENDEAVRLMMSRHIPFVLVSRKFPKLDVNSVISDEYQGAKELTQHIIERGAKEILFLNGPSYVYNAGERARGYTDALKEAGLSPLIYETSTEYGKVNERIQQLQQESVSYDAVITFCDMMAYEAYFTLHQMGVKIPEEKKVAGIDGLYQDAYAPIDLTTAALDKQELAKQSVKRILELIEQNDEESGKDIILKQQLHVGETT